MMGVDGGSTAAAAHLPPLPLELWQRVIFFVDAWPLQDSGERARRQALHSLSLVSSWMHEAAQPYLYAYPCLVADNRDARLQESEDATRQRKYWETICARPALWAHTRGIFLGRRRRWLDDDAAGRHGVRGQGGQHASSSSRATSARVRSLANAIAGDSTTSSSWAESFNLVHPHLPTPIGIGPSPSCLRQVAWCEVGSGLGGLPASHAYSTRPAGKWCQGAYEMMEQRRRQVRALTVEDVDLGRGPAPELEARAMRGRISGDWGSAETAQGKQPAVAAAAAAASTSSSAASRWREQPSGLSEDDVWEAAERMTLQHSSVDNAAPVIAPASALLDVSTASASMPQQREDLRDEWLRTAKLQQEHMNREHQKRQQQQQRQRQHSSSSAPPTSSPPLVPWQYRLTLGSLDSHTLPHLICSLPTLTHLHLTLYLGTHLDHDLLEHQLRLCLDSAQRLPLLQCLEVRAGYDALGGGGVGGGRLKREAYQRIVRGAVERVGDVRCRFVGGGDGEGEGRLVDVRSDAVEAWARDVDESRCGGDSLAAVESSDDGAMKKRPFFNGWLARDLHGTNDPIEE